MPHLPPDTRPLSDFGSLPPQTSDPVVTYPLFYRRPRSVPTFLSGLPSRKPSFLGFHEVPSTSPVSRLLVSSSGSPLLALQVPSELESLCLTHHRRIILTTGPSPAGVPLGSGPFSSSGPPLGCARVIILLSGIPSGSSSVVPPSSLSSSHRSPLWPRRSSFRVVTDTSVSGPNSHRYLVPTQPVGSHRKSYFFSLFYPSSSHLLERILNRTLFGTTFRYRPPRTLVKL